MEDNVSTLVSQVNEMLATAWKMIGGNYSFSIPDVSDMDDEKFYSSFVKIRIATEALCNYILTYEGRVSPGANKKMVLNDYINNISNIWTFPNKITQCLKSIQEASNGMVHYKDSPLNYEQCTINLQQFSMVLSWFIQEYRDTRLIDAERHLFLQSAKGALPSEDNDYHIPRKETCLEIEKKLLATKFLIISGDQGIGKTEACREYAKSLKEDRTKVYYLENVRSVDEFLAELPFRIQEDVTKQELVKRKKECLWDLECQENKQGKKIKYVFLLDNYDIKSEKHALQLEEFAKEFLEKNCKNICFIITVAGKNTREALRPYEYPLPLLSMEECNKIFSAYCTRSEDCKGIEQLIASLRHNARAIKMAAKYLDDNREVSLNSLAKVVYGGWDERDAEKSYEKIYRVMLGNFDEDGREKELLAILTLIPYSSVTIHTIASWMGKSFGHDELLGLFQRLDDAQWINLYGSREGINDEMTIDIAPNISDFLFDKFKLDLSEDCVKEYANSVFKTFNSAPNKQPQSLLLEIRPFVEQLYKRVLSVETENYALLSNLRKFYISIYDIEHVEQLSNIIDALNEKEKKTARPNAADSLYTMGIAYLNIEEFNLAVENFENCIEKYRFACDKAYDNLARAKAYYAHALAEAGSNEKAIENALEGIQIRERLTGNDYNVEKIWVSYYNYALALFHDGKYDDALAECNRALLKYGLKDNEIPQMDYSSPLHLRGQILLKLARQKSDVQLAIQDLVRSKEIRQNRGGDPFWVAQLDVYLSQGYERLGDMEEDPKEKGKDYKIAIELLKGAQEVKRTKWMTREAIAHIEKLNGEIARLKEKESEYE